MFLKTKKQLYCLIREQNETSLTLLGNHFVKEKDNIIIIINFSNNPYNKPFVFNNNI